MGTCGFANESAKEESGEWYEIRSSTLNVELIPKSEGKSII